MVTHAAKPRQQPSREHEISQPDQRQSDDQGKGNNQSDQDDAQKQRKNQGDGSQRREETKDDEQNQPKYQDDPAHEPRRLFAELLGTFALTFVAAGGEIISVISHGEVTMAARVVAPALLVMAMIYALGDVSGAHINPAVTLAFALRRDFAWRRVPGYWAAQLIGSLLAAILLRALFGLVGHLGASQAHQGVGPALVMEIVLTCFLVTVILGTATGNRLVGHNSGVAVGATIALCGLFAYPISSASMNPARSLGPAIIGGSWTNAWIYVVGPVSGALIAVAFCWILHGPPKSHEEQAASGDGG